jgi:hypothetical protein
MEGPQPAGQRCWGISLAHHQHSSPRDERISESTWSNITMTSSNIIRGGRRSMKVPTSFSSLFECSRLLRCKTIGCSNVPKSRSSKLSPNSYSSPLIIILCQCSALLLLHSHTLVSYQRGWQYRISPCRWRRCLLDCCSCTYCSVLKGGDTGRDNRS